MQKSSCLLALLSVLLFISCSLGSNEGTAKKMIEERVKERLVYPDSYKLISLKLDSCFSDDESGTGEAISIGCEICKLYSQYKEYKDKAQLAESNMNIYNDRGYSTEYNKTQYRIYKEEYDKQTKLLNATKNSILHLYKSNKELFLSMKGHEFVGFKGNVEYQAKTRGGNIINMSALFFFDKNLIQITHVFNGEDFADMKENTANDILYEFESELKGIYGE